MSALAKVLTWIDTISGHEAKIELKEDSLLKTKSLKFVQELRQELEEVAVECEFAEPNLDKYRRLMNRLTVIVATNLEECDDWDWFKLIKDGKSYKIDLLLWLGRDADSLDSRNETALHYACQMGNLETVKILLDYGADVNLADMSNSVALHYACEMGHLEIVRLLLDAGANVNAVDDYGQTASFFAKKEGKAEIVRLLSNRGAKNNLSDTYNSASSVSDFDDESGRLEIARLLDDGAAISNNMGHLDNLVLHTACMHGHLKIVKLLLDRGAYIDETDIEFGYTALQMACEYGHLDIAKLLLKRGADINIRSIGGHTALQSAKNNDDLPMVILLELMGAI